MIIKRRIIKKEDVEVKNDFRQFEDDGWWSVGEYQSYDLYFETFSSKAKYFKEGFEHTDVYKTYKNDIDRKTFFKNLLKKFELGDIHDFISELDEIYDECDAAYFLHKNFKYNGEKTITYMKIFMEFEEVFEKAMNIL